MHKVMNIQSLDKAEQTTFGVRLFDPLEFGVVKSSEFEELVKKFFASDDKSSEQ